MTFMKVQFQAHRVFTVTPKTSPKLGITFLAVSASTTKIQLDLDFNYRSGQTC